MKSQLQIGSIHSLHIEEAHINKRIEPTAFPICQDRRSSVSKTSYQTV